MKSGSGIIFSSLMGDDNSEKCWISNAPKYTTFRINALKKFDSKHIENILREQCKELVAPNIPKFYMLRPDCLVLERWPDNLSLEACEKEVIVDATCGAAVLRGAHVFAPGVLGLPSNCQIGERVDIYADLDGQCKRGLKVKYTGKKRFVGTGYLKMLRFDLFDNGVQPSGIAVHTLLPESKLPVVNETLYPKGEILLQYLPSIVCGWAVDAQPGEHILDMCAAPGNKTTHLGEMSHNRAFITAIDKSKQKVCKIINSCETQGVNCVKAYVFDSTNCCSDESCDMNNGPPFPPNTFDKVLLDAPCSGLGQRPQIVCKMTQKMLQSYKFVQRKLFKAATQVLKKGGKLVYSTCTTAEEENEKMVSWALENFPCLKLIPAKPLLGRLGLPDCGLTEEQRAMVQRFGPGKEPRMDRKEPVGEIYRETIGFFIAVFVKEM